MRGHEESRLTPIFDLRQKSGWVVVPLTKMGKFEGGADLGLKKKSRILFWIC